MLGGLARWLRMLGYVTEYNPKADDNSLIQSSQVPDSVLLTRDEELHNRALGKNIHSVLVIGGTEEARLGQLGRTLGVSLDIDMSATRCLYAAKSSTRLLRKKPPVTSRRRVSNSTIDSGDVTMRDAGRRIGWEVTGSRYVTLWKKPER